MHELHFVQRARTAAWHILRETVLGETIAAHVQDDGRLLTIAANSDDWAMLSSGERVLYGCLEQLAGERSTVTIADCGHRLDEPSRRAVLDAWEAYLLGERAA